MASTWSSNGMASTWSSNGMASTWSRADPPQAGWGVVGEVDGGPDEDGVLLGDGHAQDERLVDLQLVHRQPPQVGHGAVPGAEVVDRQVDAERVQTLEDGQAARGMTITALSVTSSRSNAAGTPCRASRRPT